MKFVRLTLICIITLLVGVQSVDAYPELKETEVENSIADEYVVFSAFKETKEQVVVHVQSFFFRGLKADIVVETEINSESLFLKHRSLII